MINVCLLSVRSVTHMQGIALIILFLFHCVTLYLKFVENIYFRTFDLNNERNIPTYYQMGSLWFASYLIGVIAYCAKQEHRKFFSLWVLLSAIFFFLGIDEGFTMHERFNQPVADRIDLGNVRFYAWVIPYAVMVFCFAVGYLRFLFDLPNRFRILFVVSGALYVCGAIGMEIISFSRAAHSGLDDLGYELLATVEEMLELLGIAVFNYSLLSYLVAEFGEKVFRFFKITYKVTA